MRRNQKRKKRKKIAAWFQFLAMNMVATIAIVSIAFLFYKNFHINMNIQQEDTEKQQQEKTKQTEVQQKNLTSEVKTERVGDEEAKKIWSNYKDLLMLVNKENACPIEELPRRKICNGRLEAAEVLYEDLCQMLADASSEGHKYWIASAYRSADKQQQLVNEDVRTAMAQGLNYEEALKKTYEETMPAGYSEHQTGLALDILSSGNMRMDVTQENTVENKWLQERCYEYGFILRYPSDKEDVTKISYEPWHLRYVGKEAAKYIMKNHLTLEEFYAKI